MVAEVHTLGDGNFGTSVEMFVSLLLARVRQNQDVEAIVFAVVQKDGRCDVGSSGMEIRDLAYAGRAMQLYVDEQIRNNADFGDVTPLGDPA